MEQPPKEKEPNRTPPAPVRRALRKEVGFGCPVPGCGNPYLEWHHFDPAWSTEKHHRPEGMIALCVEHHKKADAGAFTVEQLRQFKTDQGNAKIVKGKFDWMRNRILLAAGAGFFYECDIAIMFHIKGKDYPIMWFNRDEDDYMLLNVQFISDSPEPRAIIEDSYWLTRGTESDVVSPPHGKLIEIRYSNKDLLKVEFFEVASADEMSKFYGGIDFTHWKGVVDFPITVVEVEYVVPGAGTIIKPGRTGNIRGNFLSAHGKIGLMIG